MAPLEDIAPSAPAVGLRAICQGVDSHAHVFKRGYRLAPGRRYSPSTDATVDDYLAQLDANGMSHGVLIQPSFYGADNECMIDALQRGGARLRGVAVVDPEISAHDLWSLDALGVTGVRLNLVGAEIPQLDAGAWPVFLRRIADLGWHVEIQSPAAGLLKILPALLAARVDIVIDHYGLPNPHFGVTDPAFEAFLAYGRRRSIWIKVSAPYRAGGLPIATEAYPLLRDAFGLTRLIWGSDWPHTNFETSESYAANKANFEAIVPDASERKVILVDNPWTLFRFTG
jgi:predicted TIM-barrel fold metal-dependent hydrolase